jgi:hypothetical protein
MVGYILNYKWSGKLSSIVGKLVKNIDDKKAVNALIPILREEDDVPSFLGPLNSWLIYNPQSVDLIVET